VQGGIRYERTLTTSEVFEQGERRDRRGGYDDLFLSGAARCRFTEDLMGIVSFNQSIKRAALVNMTGVATINEDNLTGVMPNLNLKPEYADNYAARLEYYFEPVGVLSAGVYRMDVKDLHQTATIAAEEIGVGAEYPGYFFSTTTNRDRIGIEGFEFEYRQQLTFLPGILGGLGVFGNYSRSRYSDAASQYGIAPKVGSAGVSFRYRSLSAAVRAAWRSDLMLNATTLREERTHVSTTLDYQWSRRVTLFIAGRNILNAPLFQYSPTLTRHLTQFRTYGANWTIGVKTKL
jgi:outer membrane receptor protein involved in Fe transport